MSIHNKFMIVFGCLMILTVLYDIFRDKSRVSLIVVMGFFFLFTIGFLVSFMQGARAAHPSPSIIYQQKIDSAREWCKIKGHVMTKYYTNDMDTIDEYIVDTKDTTYIVRTNKKLYSTCMRCHLCLYKEVKNDTLPIQLK